MYVTRTLSSLRSSPHTMSTLPDQAPFSGVAVILDKEIEEHEAGCCGLSDEIRIKKCPFPQNKLISISYNNRDDHEYVMMIPVVDQPLSSNRYYVIRARFNRVGQAVTCSREEDGMQGCCFPIVKDVKPRPFEINNTYQQLKIIETGRSGRFYAESEARDGRAPYSMSKGNWVDTMASPASWNVDLTEAGGQGLNATLRGQLPGFGFPIGLRTPDRVVVGRWYVPFLFVKESGMSLKQQMRRSTYYKMSLEQRWEQVFGAENVGGGMTAVAVEAVVRSEVVVLGGRVGVEAGGGMVDDGGVMCFGRPGEGGGVGLSLGIVERMKWEEGRGGWVDVGGGQVRVERVEEHGGGRAWRRFGCYVLVESFVLKRMDDSLVLTYDFYHLHQLRTKWEQV